MLHCKDAIWGCASKQGPLKEHEMKTKENQHARSVVRELKKVELSQVSGGENMQALALILSRDNI